MQSVCFAQDTQNTENQRFLPGPIETPSEQKELKKETKKWGKKKKADVAQIEITSDYMDYFPEEDKVIATGNAYVVPEDKLSKLKADKITFYRETNELVAEGNVKLLKNGVTICGTFMRIDMNKNSALMENPNTEFEKIKIVAKEGYAYANDIDMLKGTAKIPENMKMLLSTNSMQTGFELADRKAFMKLSESPEYLAKSKQKAFKIKTKEIILDSGKERNIITMKNATIYKNRLKVATIPSLVLSGDKNFSEIDTTLPEFGYLRQLGLYMGPSWLTTGPLSSTVKLAPLFVAEGGKAGIGGLARIKNDRNHMEMFYGTATETFIVQGSHEFSDKRVKLNYGSNAFIDDWFMGRKMPNKFSEIEFKDSVKIEDLGLIYKYKYAAAYASDYHVGNSQDVRMNSSRAMANLPEHTDGWGTMRLKAQGEFRKAKPLWKKGDDMELNVATQYDFNQYGTGQNLTVVRIGPTFTYTPVESKFRFMGSYFMAGVSGSSPFTWDQYYFGKQSFNGAYEYKLTEKLSLGYANTLNLLRDNFDGRFLAGNRFYFKYGPEDFKLCFAYDTVYQRTFFGLNMLVGADQSDIDFDKLKVKEYKKLKKQQDTKNADIRKQKLKKQKKEEQKV